MENGIAKVSEASSSSLSLSKDATSKKWSNSSESANNSRIDILAANAGVVREPITVNNVNVSDLKNACDDVVKRLLSQPDLFQENHQHMDVKLALGWASALIACGTTLYGWKAGFESSKPVVISGFILYVLLMIASTLYSFFIEKDTVYIGRRKVLAKRIETERITIASRTLPSAAPQAAPRYRVSIFYVRSSNAGKSLLGRGQMMEERPFSEFFDEEGKMDQERFERWIAGLVERVMDGR